MSGVTAEILSQHLPKYRVFKKELHNGIPIMKLFFKRYENVYT
jgi:hypothetical protein